MAIVTSAAEDLAHVPWTDTTIVNGTIYGDPFTYERGTSARALRSGVDGPHAKLADQLCKLNGRLYG